MHDVTNASTLPSAPENGSKTSNKIYKLGWGTPVERIPSACVRAYKGKTSMAAMIIYTKQVCAALYIFIYYIYASIYIYV